MIKYIEVFYVLAFTFLLPYGAFAQHATNTGESIIDSPRNLSNLAKIASATEINLVIQADGIDIGGTLTIPAHQAVSSLVIMSSGSGPQDRDETLDGFKIFGVLAHYLATEGIASFRFDDRGVGESTGDFANSTLGDFSEDIRRIMAFFKTYDAHPFKDFILFGHSLGGIVVGNVAVGNEDVKQVILMGAPSVPLIEVISYQIRQEYVGIDIDKSLVEAEVSAHNRLMRAIVETEDLDEPLKVFYESTLAVLSTTRSEETTNASELQQISRDKTKEMEIVYALPCIASFLYHDPASTYEQLQVPVLSLFGGKDLQVTIDQNKDRMENALLRAKNSYHFVTFSDANHYFQAAETGKREEYESLAKAFVGGFLEEISAWIIGH